VSDKITLAKGFVAEPRESGYYVIDSNGGGAMANAVEIALIQALIDVRAERDGLRVAAQIVLDRWHSKPLTLGMLRGPMEDLEREMEVSGGR